MFSKISWVWTAPFLIFPMFLYWGLSGGNFIHSTILQWRTPSGGMTILDGGLFLIFLGIVCLLIEVWKATSTGKRAIIDQVLSVCLFVIGLILYLMLPSFGTATFLTLLLLQFVDVMAGTVVMIVGARRDFNLGGS